MKKVIYVDSEIVNRFLIKVNNFNTQITNSTKKAILFRKEHITENEHLYNICNVHRGDELYIIKDEVPSQEVIDEYNKLEFSADTENKLTLLEYISNENLIYFFIDNDIIIKRKRDAYFKYSNDLTQINLNNSIHDIINDNVMDLSKTNIFISVGSHRHTYFITDDIDYDFPNRNSYGYELYDITVPFNEYDGNYKKLRKQIKEVEINNQQTTITLSICGELEIDNNGIVFSEVTTEYDFQESDITEKQLNETYIKKKYKQTETNKIITYTSPIKESFVAIDTENEKQIGYTVVENGTVMKPVLIDFTKECPYKKENVLHILKKKFKDKRIIAHNAYVDARVINNMFNEKLIYNITDTLNLAKKLYKDEFEHNLETLAARFNIRYGKPHMANNDSLGCAMIMLKMLEEHNIHSIEEAEKIYHIEKEV